MSQILQKVRDVDATNSDAVKEAITSFFQSLLNHKDVNCIVWLRVLEDVLTRFPRYCSQHRPTIENYLAHFLDSSNYYDVIVAAKCAHSLQQIRPSQDKTASPKNCWREQMTILCNTAHALIEVIFSKTVNIYKTNKSVKQKGAELLANSPLTKALSNILTVKKSQGYSSENKKTILSIRLKNIFVFIQAMLVEVYPVAKPVQPQLILEVIILALSMSCSVNTDATEAATVKTQGLRVLDAMILCLGPNLIPFSGLVFKFMMQTLKWSSDNPSEESRKVRITAYTSLTKWFGILHVHRVSSEGRGRCWEENELTRHIIEDITPLKKIVQLTMSNQYTKNLSKKAKKKLANQTLQQSTLAGHMPGEKNKINLSDESNDELAIAALECAETFLTVSGIFLKPPTHKMYQERLVRECFNLDDYSVARSVRLLRALDAARKNTSSIVPPPTQYCVQLYSTHINSRYDEIKNFCSQALLDIRLHLHCSPASINFALDVQPDTKTGEKKTKEISQENRVALEFLIRERARPLTVEDTQEKAVGEPSNKKARLEADRISISSDSDASVVIPDGSDDEVEEIEPESSDSDDVNGVEIITEDDVVEEEILPEPDFVEVETLPEPNVEEVEIVPEPDVEEVAILPGPESEESSKKTSEDNKETMNNNVTVKDSVDTTDSNQNSRKRKLSEPCDLGSIYDAKTQVPLNSSNETTEDGTSSLSLEVAYDAVNVDNKVKTFEKLDDDDLPSTNETDDVQITCGQTLVGSQKSEPSKDTIEVEIEISAVGSDIEVNGESKEISDGIAENDNIAVKITSKEISVEEMLADFVDEVNEESLIA